MIASYIYFNDFEGLSRAAAEYFRGVLDQTLKRREFCFIALSGGRTPFRLYEILTNQYHFQKKIPWEKIYIFWSDERYVPQNDPRSNFYQAGIHLLSHLPEADQNIFPVDTSFPSINDSAAAYEKEIRARLPKQLPPGSEPAATDPVPAFDLILLGMGSDGHTASLFPGYAELGEETRLITATKPSPIEPAVPRITFTFKLINQARHICFLVEGEQKQAILDGIINHQKSKQDLYPAARVRPLEGELTWFIT